MTAPAPSTALGPRCRERGQLPSWTLVGSLDGDRPARVDGAGLITPHGAPWSIDWWIGADDRWYLPAREATVRQHRQGPGPVLTTSMRIPSGDAHHRVHGAVVGGRDVTVIEVENDSPVPVALALALRPYTVDDEVGPASLDLRLTPPLVLVDGAPALGLPRAPNEAAASTHEDLVATVTSGGELVWDTGGHDRRAAPGAGPANAVVLYPLPHRTTLRFVIPASPVRGFEGPAVTVPAVAGSAAGSGGASTAAVPAVDDVPDHEAVARGWRAVVEGRVRYELPDDGLGLLLGAARARLVSGSDRERRMAVGAVASSAGPVLEALARAGHRDEVGPMVAAAAQAFPRRLSAGPRAGADLVAALAPALVTLEAEPGPELLETAAQLTHLVEKAVGRRRAASDPLVARARRGLADLAGLAGDEAGRRHLLRALDPAPTADPGRAADLAAAASEARSWGTDDIEPAARYVLAVLDLLVDDRGEDLVLLPHHPTAWRGGGVEVHRTPTVHGPLSYGIRWHGPRPALLWDLERPAGAAPVRLVCPGLDPDWSSDEARGETLLAGSTDGLAAVPGPGDGFR